MLHKHSHILHNHSHMLHKLLHMLHSSPHMLHKLTPTCCTTHSHILHNSPHMLHNSPYILHKLLHMLHNSPHMLHNSLLVVLDQPLVGCQRHEINNVHGQTEGMRCAAVEVQHLHLSSVVNENKDSHDGADGGCRVLNRAHPPSS